MECHITNMWEIGVDVLSQGTKRRQLGSNPGICVCVCVCLRACVCARARACVCMCVRARVYVFVYVVIFLTVFSQQCDHKQRFFAGSSFVVTCAFCLSTAYNFVFTLGGDKKEKLFSTNYWVLNVQPFETRIHVKSVLLQNRSSTKLIWFLLLFCRVRNARQCDDVLALFISGVCLQCRSTFCFHRL